MRSYLSVSSASRTYAFTQPFAQLPLMCLLAVLLGALGALWVGVNAAVCKLRRRWSHSKAALMAEARSSVLVLHVCDRIL